jgi:hypothetical protein
MRSLGISHIRDDRRLPSNRADSNHPHRARRAPQTSRPEVARDIDLAPMRDTVLDHMSSRRDVQLDRAVNAGRQFSVWIWYVGGSIILIGSTIRTITQFCVFASFAS